MIVYRLTKKKYRNDLSGRGAELVGGRWNNKGIALIYTSSNRALCTAEIAAHTPFGILPENYYLLIIELPDDNIQEVKIEDVPEYWRSFPHYPTTRQIGDDFVYEGKDLALKVPAAVVQGEFNILINPRHPDIKKVKVIDEEYFGFDTRLFI